MATKGRKLSKKDLKQPDEFITLSTRAILFARKHKREVLWGVGILVGILLIVTGVTYYFRTLNRQAFALLTEANTLAESAEKRGEAQKLYEKIVQDYSLSRASLQAHLQLGHLYFQNKEYDKAVQEYQAALKKAPQGSTVREVALISLAYAYEQSDRCAQAIETAQEIIDDPAGKLTYEALMLQGRCYEVLQNPAQALASYEQVLEKFPSIAARVDVESKVARLRKKTGTSSATSQ
ncbi:MAG: tetratricopeptide repeat protein [Nitrospinota bacterium]|nr:MAG: tetratricopeptide repeat protein [Nitrospinota bacterium]